MATLKEKIGYGFGDMSSSMFWKIFSYYLPIFYSNIYGLSLADTGVLLLVTRIWDAVSDPMMGIIADRTHTRWGKYRPYLLWISLPFAVCGILMFTTPDFGPTGKLVWAYLHSDDDGLYSYQCSLWGYVGSDDGRFGYENRVLFLPDVLCLWW